MTDNANKYHQLTQLSERDREISLIAWGFTLGFGYLTAWKGCKQTSRIPREIRYKSLYFWLVWMEVVSIFGYGGLTWLHVQNYVKPNFALFFFIFVFWSIQSQAQAQIIINRISVIIVDKRKTDNLRRGVFILIFILCNISGVLWIGHSLEVNEVFTHGDNIYTRVEGVIFILCDICLNLYFIKCVKKQLLDSGLEKYRPLMDFVIKIVFISVAIDVLIVGMMSYKNPRMWLQFHPLGFIVKLNIELSMANLIAKLARKSDFKGQNGSLDLSKLSSHHDQGPGNAPSNHSIPQMASTSCSCTCSCAGNVHLTLKKPQDAVVVDIESLRSRNASAGSGKGIVTYEHDEHALQEERDWERLGQRRSQLSCV